MYSHSSFTNFGYWIWKLNKGHLNRANKCSKNTSVKQTCEWLRSGTRVNEDTWVTEGATKEGVKRGSWMWRTGHKHRTLSHILRDINNPPACAMWKTCVLCSASDNGASHHSSSQQRVKHASHSSHQEVLEQACEAGHWWLLCLHLRHRAAEDWETSTWGFVLWRQVLMRHYL